MTVAGARPPGALVSFVGAGPGDPELITLKGLRRLRAADVVIHDRLIPAALLVQARPDAEIIDAGKAPGRHCPAQEDINRLIVDRATRGGRVVRLKGRDPSLFGRLGGVAEAGALGGSAFRVGNSSPVPIRAAARARRRPR